jgi:uncharacterized delta-60 repeat protein
MKKILILFVILAYHLSVQGQTPFIDASFATGGREVFTSAGALTTRAIAIDTNGNIYTGGKQIYVSGSTNNVFQLTKTNSAGVADNSFGTQGVVTTDFNSSGSSYLNAIAITQDQKVVAGGYIINSGNKNMLLARYNPTGTLDSSFGINGFVTTSIGTNAVIRSIVIQNDNKIVVAGYSLTNRSSALVARYNSSGNLDATFGTNGIDTFHYSTTSNDSVNTVKIQTGGKIVVGGMTLGGTMMLARLNTVGVIDSTFGVNGMRPFSNPNYVPGTFRDMTLLPDASIITTDYRNGTFGVSKAYIKKFSVNGSFDSTFTNQPASNKGIGVLIDFSPTYTYTTASTVYALAITTDGGILAAGSTQSAGGDVPTFIKLKSNGNVDSSVGVNGLIVDGNITTVATFKEITSVAIQKDNKIVAGIGGYNSNAQIFRYTNIPLFLGNDQSICQGSSITLNAGNPGSIYLWSTGATTQTINVTDSGNYAVKVTNSLGAVTDTIHIAYYPNPVVNLGNDTTFCSGNMLTLNAGNSGSTYLWNTSATTQTIGVTTSGIYSVSVTDVHQCVGKDTVQVTVSTSPVIVNLGSDTSFCAGNTLTLNAGNAGSSYLWNNTASSQTIDVTTSGTYAVTVTDQSQCKGSDTINITVNPLPVVNLGNDTTFCAGNILDAQNAGMSFLWNTNATTQTIAVTNSGTYSVRVTDANQCSSSDTIQVITNPLPVVNLGNDTFAGNGNIITLDAGNAGDTYLWNTGATSQTINVINSGTYSVVVTNQNGCSSTDSIVITFGIVSIHPVAGNNYQWSVSPNPANDFINVNINDLKLLNTSITITDIYGRIIKTITLKSKSQAISLDTFVNGLYILKMQNGESVKFVKD